MSDDRVHTIRDMQATEARIQASLRSGEHDHPMRAALVRGLDRARLTRLKIMDQAMESGELVAWDETVDELEGPTIQLRQDLRSAQGSLSVTRLCLVVSAVIHLVVAVRIMAGA